MAVALAVSPVNLRGASWRSPIETSTCHAPFLSLCRSASPTPSNRGASPSAGTRRSPQVTTPLSNKQQPSTPTTTRDPLPVPTGTATPEPASIAEFGPPLTATGGEGSKPASNGTDGGGGSGGGSVDSRNHVHGFEGSTSSARNGSRQREDSSNAGFSTNGGAGPPVAGGGVNNDFHREGEDDYVVSNGDSGSKIRCSMEGKSVGFAADENNSNNARGDNTSIVGWDDSSPPSSSPPRSPRSSQAHGRRQRLPSGSSPSRRKKRGGTRKGGSHKSSSRSPARRRGRGASPGGRDWAKEAKRRRKLYKRVARATNEGGEGNGRGGGHDVFGSLAGSTEEGCEEEIVLQDGSEQLEGVVKDGRESMVDLEGGQRQSVVQNLELQAR